MRNCRRTKCYKNLSPPGGIKKSTCILCIVLDLVEADINITADWTWDYVLELISTWPDPSKGQDLLDSLKVDIVNHGLDLTGILHGQYH